MTAATVFASIEDFYSDRPERLRSPEADYGVHWHVNGQRWPEWRVSYVQATGEVVAVCTGGQPRGQVRVLGVVPADPQPERGEARWDHDKRYYRTLDRILDGWADPDISGFDLAWVEARLGPAS